MNHSSLMSYHDFFSMLSNALLDELGEAYEAHPVTNAKNNGVCRNGIVIRQEGERTAPTIYLDSYYQEYQSGRILSDIVRHILYVYRESTKEQAKYDLEELELTADYIRKHIICSLVNYAKNKPLLAELPHIRIFDLAIVFKLLVYQNNTGIGTIRFTKEHQMLLSSDTSSSSSDTSIRLHALYQLALSNTERLFPVRLSSLADTMEGILYGNAVPKLSFTQPLPISNPPIYVLTNTNGIGGATCILYPKLLSQLKRCLPSDFFILPSSIHEMLIMPASSSFSHEQLNDMIREINQTQVPVEDVLSNTAYHSSEWSEVLLALSEHTDPLPHTCNP